MFLSFYDVIFAGFRVLWFDGSHRFNSSTDNWDLTLSFVLTTPSLAFSSHYYVRAMNIYSTLLQIVYKLLGLQRWVRHSSPSRSKILLKGISLNPYHLNEDKFYWSFPARDTEVVGGYLCSRFKNMGKKRISKEFSMHFY